MTASSGTRADFTSRNFLVKLHLSRRIDGSNHWDFSKDCVLQPDLSLGWDLGVDSPPPSKNWRKSA